MGFCMHIDTVTCPSCRPHKYNHHVSPALPSANEAWLTQKVDELEARIVELERKIAQLSRKPSPAKDVEGKV